VREKVEKERGSVKEKGDRQTKKAERKRIEIHSKIREK